jgi:TolB-like protein/Tfp pilus assembly protein PilF
LTASANEDVRVSAKVGAEDGFRIAVLPFRWSGSESHVQSCADGFTEDIVNGLSRFSYLRVIAASSMARYRGCALDLRAAREEIEARYLLEGSLRQAGARVRLVAQLVDCDSGAHLWAETYDREFDANAQFELLDDLVPQIVSSIADLHGVLLRCVSEVLRGADPATLTPYAAVLRSFAYLQRPNAEEHRLTREALESALERSPAYADAWAALSLLCHEEFAQGFNIHPNPLDRAHDAARRAIDLAPSNHLAHHALAAVEFFRKEMQRFRLAAARAFELNPMDGSTLAHLGSLLAYAGDWKRGGTLCASARRLNPHHPGWYWFVHGLDAYRNGDCRASLEFADRANMPEAWQTNLLLAAAHAHLGHKAAATKALLALVSQRQDFAEAPRQALSVWWQPEMVEKLMAGLEMAGLRVSARS